METDFETPKRTDNVDATYPRLFYTLRRKQHKEENKVNNFNNYHFIVKDRPTQNKSKLSIKNSIRKDDFQSICKHLRNNLIEDITQSNRSSILHSSMNVTLTN
jgi:hypothetical protein